MRGPLLQPIFQPIMQPIMRGVMDARRSGFSVRSLFAKGQQGVWYDPSDTTTLFQDSAGTIPVTGTEQPVGLMLDKSKGLVLGPETVVNGTFDTNTSGWAVSNANATLTWQSGGTALFQNVADFAYVQSSANLPLVAGQSYQVSFDVIAISHTSTSISVGPGASVLNISPTIPKSYSYVYRATGPATFQIRPSNAGVGTIQIDNISVKLLPGNHATQPTASKRPILQESGGLYSLKFDRVDDFMSTAAIDFSGTDKLSAWVGVTKLNDAARMVAELSATSIGNSGSFFLEAGTGNGYSHAYSSLSRGTSPATTGQTAGYSGAPAPDTAALTITHDISGDLSTIKRNGVAGVNGTFNKGDGNFGNHPLYIASRGGTSSFFNGNIYLLVIAGALYDADTVAKMNAWTAKKTGVTI